MTPRLAVAIAALGIGLAAAVAAGAQTAPADTTAQATPADTTSPPPMNRARAARAALGRDVQRIEFGAAVVDGPFDVIGTIGYHRYARQGGPFENWVHAELSGSATKYLREGALSAGYFLRPLVTIQRQWPIQPILEVGPAGHLVVQVVEVQGFGETAFHAHAYLKTHAIAGFETHLGTHWGLVARGRLSVPAHHPLDYAQIALFLR